jgi:glycosyltransferase involved in cell wall biosynthesis
MYIGLIIYGSIETLTGGYLYDKYLIRHLENRGHTVEIISLPLRYYCRHLLDNFSKKFLTRLLQTPFDVLLQDEFNHPSLFLLNRLLQRRVSFPIVAIVHQVLCRQPRKNWQNALYRAIETRYLSSVDAYIFNSRTTHATVDQLVNIKSPSIVACPGGDRLGFLRSEEKIRLRAHESGPLRLLFIGNILPHKGLYELIAALYCISKEKWRLTVVGSLSMDREYVRNIELLISQKHLPFDKTLRQAQNRSQQILLAGTLAGDELAILLSQSHVYVMPFSHEGFGIVYLEAMAYGLPAIGSSEGAVKEVIRHGHNGFLVARNDPETLIQHIETLYGDRDRLAKMGLAAMETFHSHPTWADSMESILAFLENLV